MPVWARWNLKIDEREVQNRLGIGSQKNFEKINALYMNTKL